MENHVSVLNQNNALIKLVSNKPKWRLNESKQKLNQPKWGLATTTEVNHRPNKGLANMRKQPHTQLLLIDVGYVALQKSLDCVKLSSQDKETSDQRPEIGDDSGDVSLDKKVPHVVLRRTKDHLLTCIALRWCRNHV